MTQGMEVQYLADFIRRRDSAAFRSSCNMRYTGYHMRENTRAIGEARTSAKILSEILRKIAGKR